MIRRQHLLKEQDSSRWAETVARYIVAAASDEYVDASGPTKIYDDMKIVQKTSVFTLLLLCRPLIKGVISLLTETTTSDLKSIYTRYRKLLSGPVKIVKKNLT